MLFGIPNLDLQGEVNIAKPYTFSHNTTFGNYSGYRQPIGHPLGANFNELIGIIRYQPLPRLNLAGKLIVMKTGRDTTACGRQLGRRHPEVEHEAIPRRRQRDCAKFRMISCTAPLWRRGSLSTMCLLKEH